MLTRIVRVRVARLFCFGFCLFTQGHLLAQKGVANTEDNAPSNWRIGVFVQGGFVPRYVFRPLPPIYVNEELEFYSLGLQAGRQMRRAEHLGFLTGRGEALVEIQPIWIARYPPQTEVAYYYIGSQKIFLPSAPPFSKTIYGGGITPFLLRWNFDRSNGAREIPWLQLGGGILRTNQNFPLSNTASNVNFVPQAAAGMSLFTRPNRSVDLAFKFIHISNAGLGDTNPAIHASLNFSLGYSWWK